MMDRATTWGEHDETMRAHARIHAAFLRFEEAIATSARLGRPMPSVERTRLLATLEAERTGLDGIGRSANIVYAARDNATRIVGPCDASHTPGGFRRAPATPCGGIGCDGTNHHTFK